MAKLQKRRNGQKPFNFFQPFLWLLWNSLIVLYFVNNDSYISFSKSCRNGKGYQGNSDQTNIFKRVILEFTKIMENNDDLPVYLRISS